jgi:hypothetical protein
MTSHSQQEKGKEPVLSNVEGRNLSFSSPQEISISFIIFLPALSPPIKSPPATSPA